MRDKSGKKPGALTPAECVELASELIAEHGICLFIIDVVNSRFDTNHEGIFKMLDFTKRANELFSDYFPENTLSIGPSRVDKGFVYGIGDAAWVGISDANMIPKILELRDQEFPDLNLHLGVAIDTWDKRFALAK